MKCTKCQSENPEGARFCIECGTSLEFHCPKCGASTPSEGKFCVECGYNLRDTEEVPPFDYSEPQSYTPKFLADKILTTRSAVEGERKLVTVLFADVANYTAIAEKLDPEEVHKVMDGCFKVLIDEIHRFEGTINQFTGDGVMALFGAPLAHEDHAQRAGRAALSIQKRIGEYGEKIKGEHGVEFNMRIGLGSGPVIVGSIGDDLRMDYTAVGDTTNLAARIQQAAKPGDIWMSDETRAIIHDYFENEPVGKITLKGKARPQRLYRILSERVGVRTRFEAGLGRGITELVGRRPEMDTLRAGFERAKSGEAQVIDVVGEAGVGKSRLVYEFQKVLGEGVGFLSGVCIQYGRNISFLPVIDIVKETFDITEGMTEGEAGDRIEEKAGQTITPMIPFYRNLLSLKTDDPKFNALDPEGRKFGTFEAVKDLVLALSQENPLVVFLEDVHWMDKISEEFFTYFARCILNHPILMLAAYRPEASPAWAQGTHYQRLGLETLSSKSSIRLVRNIVGGVALDANLEEKIVEKTGGNPFFVEEIVRELLERGDLLKAGNRYIYNRPIDQLEIPSTIQGVLSARMDRLSDDLKRTMQVASVIGRDFAFRLLKSIMALGDELRTNLTNLVGLEILYEKALYPELEYIFKHALTQEVAYESLLKQRRREIHDRIARTIEELYPDRLEEHYEILAHHHERSGNAAKAVDYLILAGEKSNQHQAVQSAYELFDKALELTESERVALDKENDTRLHYGRALAAEGIGAVDAAVKGFEKAIELSQRHGLTDYEKGSLEHTAFLAYLSPVKSEAQRVLERGITRARGMNSKALESWILSLKGIRMVLDGQLYGGSQIVDDAERLAMQSESLQVKGSVATARSFTERWLGRPAKAVELTEGLIEVYRSDWSVVPLSYLIYNRGVALAETGRIEDGMAILRDGIEICENYGAYFRLGALYNSLGYCYGEIYQPERAWECNLRSEEIARKQMAEYPMGRRQFAEIVAHANVNLMENLFDQGKLDSAWNRMKSLQEEGKGEEFDMFRHQWESRMNYLAAQIHLYRDELPEAELLVRQNLQAVREQHAKKREGSFLRLLGELQSRHDKPEKAIQSLKEAVRILKEVGNPRQLWQGYSSLGSVYDELGKLSEAREQWRRAADVIHRTADGLSDHQLRESFLNAEAIRRILSKAAS